MCNRCDETKLIIDHAVVAALKLARLMSRDMLVGFHGEALIVMPTDTGSALDVEAVIVRPESSAEELKLQVKMFMAGLILTQAAALLGRTEHAVSPELN